MKMPFALLLVILCGMFLVSDAKSKESIAVVNRQEPTPTSEVNSILTSTPTTATSTAVSHQTTRFQRRKYGMSREERRCCKLGERAYITGWRCKIDKRFAFQYMNMVHRRKMKFEIRKPSKRTIRFVRRIEKQCVKKHLKTWFSKCCNSFKH
ncbi:hypothetical protein AC249_AIPGENE24485 [Exaiptasia diaphana]|nr:hypothetical protein AC249_AIPGENE24485 [Exaiptasia diaphana]